MKSTRKGSKSAAASRNGHLHKVALSSDELRALRTACDHYRHSIPVYLASSQSELRVLRAVIRKLS